ncbi:MAG: TIR domain-containing protein [Chloroflexota bacterium]|nr:TIR domain-containing protein [Chloroflexota bacterium]
MATMDIFVSFEFDKDRDLRDSFYEQAKLQTQHRIRNCSLREAYPTEEWKREAREAIRGCDVVIVLIGEDTHNAPGVRTEVDMARSFGKPTLQVRPKKRPYAGVAGVEDPIPWRWKQINRRLDEI